MNSPAAVIHGVPPVVMSTDFDLSLVPDPATPIGSPEFLATAGHAELVLPTAVYNALVDFAEHGNATGALLVHNMPVGAVPATPAHPTATTNKDRVSEFVLLTVARCLGEPVGYRPEHGGDVVQNILPVAGAATSQVSTSSSVVLAFHTELAFHPHKPRFLLLLCLTGDSAASTTLSSISAVLPVLSDRTREILSQPRFHTRPDRSFLAPGALGEYGPPMAVLSGTADLPTLTFDADLMVGIDDEAAAALRELGRAIEATVVSLTLARGDLLVVDNHAAVHGRSPFAARFDGTDRWIQRTSVVSDLSASANDRVGRVIVTEF